MEAAQEAIDANRNLGGDDLMDGLVSAVVARAVFIDGNDVSYVDADAPTVRHPATIAAIPNLLLDAHDVVTLKNTSIDESLRNLLQAWNSDRALRMLDIILDETSDDDELQESAVLFSQLIANPETKIWVDNWVLAIPRSSEENLLMLADRVKNNSHLTDYIRMVFRCQPSIEQVRKAWNNVSDNLFEDATGRAQFELAAIRCGAFRSFVEALGDAAAIKSAVSKSRIFLRQQPNARIIVSDWTRILIDRPTRCDEYTELGNEDRFPQKLKRFGSSLTEVFRNAQLLGGKWFARWFMFRLFGWFMVHMFARILLNLFPRNVALHEAEMIARRRWESWANAGRPAARSERRR